MFDTFIRLLGVLSDGPSLVGCPIYEAPPERKPKAESVGRVVKLWVSKYSPF